MKEYTIAVVGATGMVGRMFLKVLEERRLPVKKYYLFASKRSAGSTVDFMGEKHTILELTEDCFKGKNIDFALFSAGGGTSLKFAPIAAAEGITVIDNTGRIRAYNCFVETSMNNEKNIIGGARKRAAYTLINTRVKKIIGVYFQSHEGEMFYIPVRKNKGKVRK